MEMQEDVRDRNNRSRRWAVVVNSMQYEFCLAVGGRFMHQIDSPAPDLAARYDDETGCRID